MAKKTTDFIAKHLLFSDYWEVWTDLTGEQLKNIEGIMYVSMKNPFTVEVDKRYNSNEVIAEIEALAKKKAIK